MKKNKKCLILATLALWPSFSCAGSSSVVLQDGVNRAPAMTLHCVSSKGVAIPCGVAATPLYTIPTGDTATASNQVSELSLQQIMSMALGSPADSEFNSGAGSVVAILKGIYAAVGNIGAVTGGAPISRSSNVQAQQSTTLFSQNANRKYLAFQVPAGSYLWVNLAGGPAAPNGMDCAYFPAGTFYESGSFVNRGQITVFSPVAALISAWEY